MPPLFITGWEKKQLHYMTLSTCNYGILTLILCISYRTLFPQKCSQKPSLVQWTRIHCPSQESKAQCICTLNYITTIPWACVGRTHVLWVKWVNESWVMSHESWVNRSDQRVFIKIGPAEFQPWTREVSEIFVHLLRHAYFMPKSCEDIQIWSHGSAIRIASCCYFDTKC